MNGFERAEYLVFTDLDGSLLDHHDYSYDQALPQLRALESQGIPVIPATSKTRLEIEQLRAELGNLHPFIAENGAAVFIPVGYFDQQPASSVERDGYWVYEMSPPRERWLKLLSELSARFPGAFEHFHGAGVDGIMRMTGLPRERAMQANAREYSEPVRWLGDEHERKAFLGCLQLAGASVLQGGRFMSVCGNCDKGQALQWLRRVYELAQPSRRVHDLAIGDSGNDCAMLEVAETALVIRSPVHDAPELQRSDRVMYSKEFGPAGWAKGVTDWLHHQQLQNRKD